MRKDSLLTRIIVWFAVIAVAWLIIDSFTSCFTDGYGCY